MFELEDHRSSNPVSFLSSDPQKRPSFLELLDRLRDLQKQYSLQAQMLKGAVK